MSLFAMSAAPVVSVKDLNFSYGDRHVLHGISFDVYAPQILCFLGPNGCGKTTLFRILSTLVPPPAGAVLLFGMDAATHVAKIRSRLGVVFQSPALDPKLRVIENLRGAGHLYGMQGRSLDAAIQRETEALGIAERLRDPVEVLSGGLRRRVEIAKALLPQPDLLIMDEPSTGLDVGAREACLDIFRNLRAAGKTILLTSHLLEEAASADRVIIMHRGAIVAEGEPAALCNALGNGILVLHARDAKLLASRIPSDAVRSVRASGNEVRVLCDEPHQLAARIAESYGDLIFSTSVSRPNLADVFAHHAGLTMAQAEAENEIPYTA